MLVPRRVKYRRQQRGRLKGHSKGGNSVAFGSYGLQALQSAWITNRQIEACRTAMTRYFKRDGKVWIKIFPHKNYTQKGVGVRMGSGKGAPAGWVAAVKRDKVLFEVGKCSDAAAKRALWLAAQKLPIRTRIIPRKNKKAGGEQ
ncbi:50S ribosomal protein L16 [Acetilactobacillus jinshanensis]|uniref:Large ribosomal subunit protein uL16 n=1 Tax=Acetilactobacillus jinshanensis TaxID=1720083 RepID=A0A4P6ZKQ0_9LACO|nr:50S ribosomal protein L16 [Acetilactobacillus jinshanensis]QBP17830.1 50S ribosomal protein L16 [Acetilactobacillus jinshanensis]URL60692.1 50S ribosomal protein L16 [uncultured bacterium]